MTEHKTNKIQKHRTTKYQRMNTQPMKTKTNRYTTRLKDYTIQYNSIQKYLKIIQYFYSINH